MVGADMCSVVRTESGDTHACATKLTMPHSNTRGLGPQHRLMRGD
jgi:hypothetical protein